MNGIKTLVSIVRVDGEVMLHDGRSGWVRAIAGMVFPPESDITIKSGSSGSADIINRRGELIHLEPGTMKIISRDFFDYEVETLRNFAITASDIMSPRSPVFQRLQPAA